MNAIKKIVVGICLVSASVVTYAQGIHSSHRTMVPLSVKESFRKDYPDANATNWKKVNGKWNADFRRPTDTRDVTACYDVRGRRIDSRFPIEDNAVPEKILERVTVKYPGQYEHHYTKIDRRGKTDLYQVKVKQHGVYKTLYLDKKGKEREYASR